MLKLSLKRTMELHKEMWEYIKSKGNGVIDFSKNADMEPDSEEIDNNLCILSELKAEFIFNKGIYETVKNNCFLCEYAANVRSYYVKNTGNLSCDMCVFCPVNWGTENDCDDYFCECGDKVHTRWCNGDFDRMINLKVKPELEYLFD